jgi:hypothetical protein
VRALLLVAALAACNGEAMPDMALPVDCIANGTQILIAQNHGHTLVVPRADVSAGLDKVYGFEGAAGHTHQVTVGAGHFQSLRAGMTVQLLSTEALAHTHSVTLVCR